MCRYKEAQISTMQCLHLRVGAKASMCTVLLPALERPVHDGIVIAPTQIANGATQPQAGLTPHLSCPSLFCRLKNGCRQMQVVARP